MPSQALLDTPYIYSPNLIFLFSNQEYCITKVTKLEGKTEKHQEHTVVVNTNVFFSPYNETQYFVDYLNAVLFHISFLPILHKCNLMLLIACQGSSNIELASMLTSSQLSKQ